ncbi:MAG TPA: PAS domain S-box protein [Candidatus Thermoplasmatota archaeon]|nr:PAS domain S-box protein [Candidatus Thermoplasmatota archaeon]
MAAAALAFTILMLEGVRWVGAGAAAGAVLPVTAAAAAYGRRAAAAAGLLSAACAAVALAILHEVPPRLLVGGLAVGATALAGAGYLMGALAERLGSARRDLERLSAARKELLEAQVLEAVQHAVICTDLDGNVIAWNHGAERIYGWSRAEALGRPILELTPTAGSAQEAQQILRQLASGGSWTGEILLRRKDGSQFWARVTDTPFLGEDGRQAGIIGVSEDITDLRAAREELDRRNRELQAVLEATPDIVARYDSTGRLRYANPAFEAATGLPAAEAVGRMVGEEGVFGATHRSAAEAVLQRVLADGRPERLEFATESAGMARHLETRFVLEPSTAPGGAHVVAITRDITPLQEARHRLAHTFRLLQSIIDVAPVALCATDAEGRIRLWNRGAERLFGHLEDEVLGQPAPMLEPGEWARLRGQPPGVPVRVEGPRRRRDGSRFEAELHGAVMGEGADVQGFVAIIVDASERMAAQRSGQELANLRELHAFKTNFLNMAAHELATPLTPLRLQMAGLLAIPHDEETAESLRLLDRNLQRLTHLVQDLLDSARLQNGRLRLAVADVDLTRSVRDTVASFAAKARADGVHVVAEAPEAACVRADPRRLDQVVVNLLHNAIKYTPEGGTVTVRVTEEGPWAVLQVQDTGVGLTAGQLERLFQPFGQVHSLTERPAKARTGTGLGLYITRELVHQQGGTIAAASAGAGRGACFTVRLPLARVPAPAPGAAASGVGLPGPPAEAAVPWGAPAAAVAPAACVP